MDEDHERDQCGGCGIWYMLTHDHDVYGVCSRCVVYAIRYE